MSVRACWVVSSVILFRIYFYVMVYQVQRGMLLSWVCKGGDKEKQCKNHLAREWVYMQLMKWDPNEQAN